MRSVCSLFILALSFAIAGCGGAGPKEAVRASPSLTSYPWTLPLSVRGVGYFVVKGQKGLAYLNAGRWQTRSDGTLVEELSDATLLGWNADETGRISESGRLVPIQVPIGKLNAVRATTNISVKGNLSAEADPAASYTAQMTAYDSLGGYHEITVLYTNHSTDMSPDVLAPPHATGSWDWTAYEGDVATGTVIGRSSDTGNSKIYSNASGDYVSALAPGGSNMISVPASNGTPAVPIKIDFSSIVQLEGSTQVVISNKNGFPPGTLVGYNIGYDGVVTGLFSNGMVTVLGRVALAKFAPGTLLSSRGAGLLVPPTGSATRFGRPGSAGFGSLGAEPI